MINFLTDTSIKKIKIPFTYENLDNSSEKIEINFFGEKIILRIYKKKNFRLLDPQTIPYQKEGEAFIQGVEMRDTVFLDILETDETPILTQLPMNNYIDFLSAARGRFPGKYITFTPFDLKGFNEGVTADNIGINTGLVMFSV